MSHDTHPTYEIVFTEGARVVQTWEGYFSRAAALAAIRDADLIIPISWEWEIKKT